jgi:hypothetical protein
MTSGNPPVEALGLAIGAEVGCTMVSGIPPVEPGADWTVDDGCTTASDD